MYVCIITLHRRRHARLWPDGRPARGGLQRRVPGQHSLDRLRGVFHRRGGKSWWACRGQGLFFLFSFFFHHQGGESWVVCRRQDLNPRA